MNSRIFKLLENNCYITLSQFNLYDITIPKNSIAYYDSKDKTLYVCTGFPRNYQGKPEKISLRVLWYDYELHAIGDTFLQGDEISIALYNAWINESRPKQCKIHREMSTSDYESMMHHSTRKKKSTGGVRLSEKTDEYTTDAIGYKQVTEYAYYANLESSKSGNASVIASNIR